jgi:hypothetical protein
MIECNDCTDCLCDNCMIKFMDECDKFVQFNLPKLSFWGRIKQNWFECKLFLYSIVCKFKGHDYSDREWVDCCVRCGYCYYR